MAIFPVDMPRDMPEHWQEGLAYRTRKDGCRVCEWTPPDGYGLSPLAYICSDDPSIEERYNIALRRSAWLTLEMKKIERGDPEHTAWIKEQQRKLDQRMASHPC